MSAGAAGAAVFLLSPADCSGKRARLLLRDGADGDLARRLCDGGAALGEVFSFVSSLYFRGKLAYALAFARPPRGIDGVHVITPCDGLRPPGALVRRADLERYAATEVVPDNDAYRDPLRRDLEALAARIGGAHVVLLGSVASPKYTDILGAILGARLHFPRDFVGRGDMSRGGLMLRCVREGRELPYVPVQGAVVHGVRPARLVPLARAPRHAAGRT